MRRNILSIKNLLLVAALILLPRIGYSQGPSTPEVSSFEPVDATDMVNLVTGDLSYVLPILNVPSPEGGYPLTLSYHAGIAVDQEASWVGLGWTLNPGSINRSVNGYPDDWNRGIFKEYYYDQGGENTFWSASLGYSIGGASIGLSVSNSDNRGFGGAVNFGYGISDYVSVGASLGSNGVGINVDIGSENSPFSVGGSISSNGIGFNVSYNYDETGYTNSSGEEATFFNKKVSVGMNTTWDGDTSVDASYSNRLKGESIGVSLSSNGLSVRGSVNGVGTGINLAFSQSISMSDYTITRSGFYLPLSLPVGPGVLSATFSYQKVKYYLDKLDRNEVSGPLYFAEAQGLIGYWKCSYFTNIDVDTNGDGTPDYTETNYGSHQVASGSHVHNDVTAFTVSFVETANSLTDITEFGVAPQNSSFSSVQSGASLPNYDNYRVAAQGISGQINPRMYETGALLGFSKDNVSTPAGSEYSLNYYLPPQASFESNFTHFDRQVNFYFENEYSSSLLINPATFDTNNVASKPYDYLSSSNVAQQIDRKKGGRYIEAYTNLELSDDNKLPFINGLLRPNTSVDYSSDSFEPDGIGAYKITAPDGKNYHFAQPVYNHEIVSRQFGMFTGANNNPLPENSGFFEKRQLKKYATHWLLTTITGPDYVDANNNEVADEGDYGYWVNFEYGKWSEGYMWYGPYGKDYNEDEQNPDLKSYTFGRKEIYYLDKIKTRTHTALFVKTERADSKGKQVTYNHRIDKNTPTRILSFPSQSLLHLREIILLKNEDAAVSTTNHTNLTSIPGPNTINTFDWFDSVNDGGGTKSVNYSLQNNVLDRADLNNANWDILRSKAIKIVDFSSFSYELVANSPNSSDGKLTLLGLALKGRGGTQTLPSYKFDYNNSSSFSPTLGDEWGYNKNRSDDWSLNKITTPQGGEIMIEYEPDSFVSAINHNLNFATNSSTGNTATMPDSEKEFFIESEVDFSSYNVAVDDHLPVVYKKVLQCDIYNPYANNTGSGTNGISYQFESYNGSAKVVSVVNSKKLKMKLLGDPFTNYQVSYGSDCASIIDNNSYNRVSIPDQEYQTGIRVKSIMTMTQNESFKTEYDYTLPGTDDTSGVVSYIPFISQSLEDVPYGADLPAPIPMYSCVKTTALGSDNSSMGYNVYHFKVIPPKDPNSVAFGDVYEINRQLDETYNSAENVNAYLSTVEIIDNTATLGQLISSETFNNRGQLIYKTVNNYKPSAEIDKGVIRESFQTYKETDFENSTAVDAWFVNSTTKTIYPSALASTTVIQNGFSATTEFVEYDFNSGQLLKTQTVASDGDILLTESVPAYTKYPEMASKVDNVTNKNMLTQLAMSKTYFNNQPTAPKLLNSSITTWKPESYYSTVYTGQYPNQVGLQLANNVWRKHQTYVWDGDLDSDGLYANYTDATDDGFNWSSSATSQPSTWKKISEITKYDPYSMILEIMDVNGNRASTKMGDDDTKIFLTGNADYDQIFFSGAEEAIYQNTLSGGITVDSNVSISNAQFHTGQNSLLVPVNSRGFTVNVSKADTYRISVWAHKDSYQGARVINGSNQYVYNNDELVFAGDWVQLNFNLVIPVGGNGEIYLTSVSDNIYFDDFKVGPRASSTVGYVYNNIDELTYVLGSNNMATQYEYNTAGKLIRTYAEVEDFAGNGSGGFKLTSENEYRYAREIVPENSYATLFLYLSIGDPDVNNTTLTANSNGGSGVFQYRWAVDDDPTVLGYGPWGTSNSVNLYTFCPEGRKYYKCQIRDMVTGVIVERSGNHQLPCSNDGSGNNPQ